MVGSLLASISVKVFYYVSPRYNDYVTVLSIFTDNKIISLYGTMRKLVVYNVLVKEGES